MTIQRDKHSSENQKGNKLKQVGAQLQAILFHSTINSSENRPLSGTPIGSCYQHLEILINIEAYAR